MTEDTAGQYLEDAKAFWARVIPTVYTALLIPVFAMVVTALLEIPGFKPNKPEDTPKPTGLPGWYGFLLIACIAVVIVVKIIDRRTLGANGDSWRPSVRVRRTYRGRGAVLAFVGAVFIGVTGSPAAADWLNASLKDNGWWILLLVSGLIAILSTWDTLTATPNTVIENKIAVYRSSNRALHADNRKLRKQRDDSQACAGAKIRELQEKLIKYERAAEQEATASV